MAEIYLVRHAQSYANLRDFTAFGNVDSELTEKGIEQALALGTTFKEEFGIVPEEYTQPVASSEFTRTQQTARYAGFLNIQTLPLINEATAVKDDASAVMEVVTRHKTERWVPDELADRGKTLFEQIQNGESPYSIFFGHAMCWAGFLLRCESELIELPVMFTEKRGFILPHASITKVII